MGLMKWNLKTNRVGETRVIKAFAFFPKTMSDSSTVVWLETYNVEEEFAYSFYSDRYEWVYKRCYAK